MAVSLCVTLLAVEIEDDWIEGKGWPSSFMAGET